MHSELAAVTYSTACTACIAYHVRVCTARCWLATLEHKELFRGRDVIWFVDNIGALQVLIKGNSSQYDAGNLCAAAHLYWASMGTRVWFEWVASDDNPSDGLSRDGLHDEWTLAQRPQWTIAEYLAPLWFSLIELPIEQMRQLYIQ